MQKGAKYSKDMIERFEVFEKKFKIEEMNISVFQDSWGDGDSAIRVVGEVIAGNLSEDIIIIITVHNEDGQMIGAELSENIRAEDFGGIHTFSQWIRVAGEESINKVRVYPVKDPSKLW
jgi:hypothetical protein